MEIEFEKESSREAFLNEDLGASESGVRSKTSHRMFYEAQTAVIQKQLGNLEKIRQDLGLSQRKMCQLLMVDPSAWTRWNRPGEEAPPHIWRALQWYMTLQEKIPGLTPQYFIGKDPQILHEKALSKINEEKERREVLESEIRSLKIGFEKQLEEQRKKTFQNLRLHRFLILALTATILTMSLILLLKRV